MKISRFDFQIVKNALRFRLFFPLSQYVKNYIYNFNSLFITNKSIVATKSPASKKTYLICVQSNGSGHFTQMIQIIELLKPMYKCIGIIASFDPAISRWVEVC